MTIPLEWIDGVLGLIALFGLAVGILSVASPKKSIELYQWIMKGFNWRVEPIDYAKELHNTRSLGLFATFVSVLLFLSLLKPIWFLLQ